MNRFATTISLVALSTQAIDLSAEAEFGLPSWFNFGSGGGKAINRIASSPAKEISKQEDDGRRELMDISRFSEVTGDESEQLELPETMNELMLRK